MTEKRFVSLAKEFTNVLPVLPVAAFAFAYLHELGFSWGIGTNILQLYRPADFLSISIQFLAPTLLPYAVHILGIMFDPVLFDKVKPTVAKKFQLVFALGFFSAFALRVFAFVEAGTFYSFATACFIFWIWVTAYLDQRTQPYAIPATVAATCAALSFSAGAIEGSKIRTGSNPSGLSVSMVDSPLKGHSMILVRLLSDGAIVTDGAGELYFRPNDKIDLIAYSSETEPWPGLQNFTIHFPWEASTIEDRR